MYIYPLIITPGGITSGNMNLRILRIYNIYVHNFAYTLYNSEFRQESDFEVKHRCYQQAFRGLYTLHTFRVTLGIWMHQKLTYAC